MADSSILIIASVTAKAGKEAELAAALREVAGPTRSQPGCIRFGLRRDHRGHRALGLRRGS